MEWSLIEAHKSKDIFRWLIAVCVMNFCPILYWNGTTWAQEQMCHIWLLYLLPAILGLCWFVSFWTCNERLMNDNPLSLKNVSAHFNSLPNSIFSVLLRFVDCFAFISWNNLNYEIRCKFKAILIDLSTRKTLINSIKLSKAKQNKKIWMGYK